MDVIRATDSEEEEASLSVSQEASDLSVVDGKEPPNIWEPKPSELQAGEVVICNNN
jgi:hypothetical protein